jgi:hypothetical protein
MSLKSDNREIVLDYYKASVTENKKRFKKGDARATSEYIYDNQKEDAFNIVNEYYTENRRVVSVTKKTKVGADGLMIEVATQMATHPDDNFIVDYDNVRILTGMSNTSWEKSMKEKAPYCFKDKIFHHGQLKHADLIGLQDALIIIDELDTGDKECQVLHNTLKTAGILDTQYMEEKNIRFLFISATMIKELHELYKWGTMHKLYKMTIPPSYIGHIDLLERGIFQEFYPLNTIDAATRWVKEDILDNYGNDYRVHLARSTMKTIGFIQEACFKNEIICLNHTSSDRISEEYLRNIFEGPQLTRHVVLVVKGFFRRADYIPNQWKVRTGATHELYTSIVDNSVQTQGFPGRYTGYWRDILDGGHKTGPYRTSIKAIEQYEATFNDPFGVVSYQTAGFKKTNGQVKITDTSFVDPKHVHGLVAIEETWQQMEIDLKKNVPIVLPMSIEDIERIHSYKTSKKRNELKQILKAHLRSENKETIADRVDTFEVLQITRPDSEGSRKRNIQDPVNAFRENKPFTINVKDKTKDSWQAIFDDRDQQIIFIMYFSSEI